MPGPPPLHDVPLELRASSWWLGGLLHSVQQPALTAKWQVMQQCTQGLRWWQGVRCTRSLQQAAAIVTPRRRTTA